MFVLSIIFFIIFFSIILILFIVLGGENHSNKYCKYANSCSASVRCYAKCKEDCDCFEDKKIKY